MKKYVLSACFGFLPFAYLVAQDLLKGKVVDASNQNSLPNASVVATGNSATSTSASGEFELKCVDSLEISVSYLGYETYRTKITRCPGELVVALQPAAVQLDEVEITATSNANKNLLYQPVSLVKLTETELKRGQGLFLDDAINTNVPGVFMERRTVSAGQQFNIRGYGNGSRGTGGISSNFDNQGSKIYLNNIPVTDAEGITLMDDIDFGSVSQVEVTKGPAGTLYGLAVAGVINLQTQKAEKGKTSVGQEVLVGDYGLSRTTTRVQIGGERSSLLLNYSNQKSAGFMDHTASQKDFVNVVGDFAPNQKQSITSYLGYSNSYDQRGGELTIDQYNNKDYSGNPNYIKNNAHSEVMSFRAGLGHTYHFTDRIANTTSVFGSGIASNVSSAGGWTDKYPINYGLRSTVDMKFDLNTRFRLSGITGLEAQRQDATSTAYNMVADSLHRDAYNVVGPVRSSFATVTRTTSVFTEWTLAMPFDISLIAGIGLSNAYLELNDRLYKVANNSASPSKQHLPIKYENNYTGMYSPHIALNKVFSKQLSVYASYSKGYKTPTSAYFYIPTTGMVNTNLKPEVGTQFEIGTKGSLFRDRLHYEIAYFNALFSDKMTQVAVPNPANTATLYTYAVNGGTVDNKGLELLVKYTAYHSDNGFFSAVRPFANFTYSDFKYRDFKYESIVAGKQSTVDYSNNAVVGVPPITANAGVDVTTKIGLYANLNYNYRDAMYFTSDEVNKTASYSLLNAKLGIKRNLFKQLGIDAYFGANNITSTQYYYMVFLNQLPDAYMPAPYKINYFGGISLKYTF